MRATFSLIADIVIEVWAKFAISRQLYVGVFISRSHTSPCGYELYIPCLFARQLGFISIEEDLIDLTYESNKSSRKEPSSSTAVAPHVSPSLYWLPESSKFESPLARLDLSFLSTSIVILPSSDPEPNPAEV
ncbi:hypothetical protein GH714_010760 [Hevea brasiliensis]|uniref:Uncharacterized protein n=1 Tax=Hevea brasiliensis TaxID=3981 RepID=A0A6A6KIH5_HEVBR|nr:hypothetical protein GH714_010760 [Hevea brasiliensis]